MIAVFRFPSDDLRISFQIVAEVGAVIALAALIWRANRWVSLAICLFCASSFYPQYDRASFLALHTVFFGATWYYAVVRMGSTESILNALCAAACVNFVFVCMQLAGWYVLIKPIHSGADVVVGLMANRNELSAVFAFCFPAFLRRGWRAFLFVPVIGLITAQSFGGAAAAACGVFCFAWLKVENRCDRIVLIPLAVLCAACLYMLNPPSVSHRFDTWVIAVKLFKEHMFLGSGVGHWKYVFADIVVGGRVGTYMETAHNEFVQVIFETGLLSVVLLSGLVLHTIKRLKKAPMVFIIAAVTVALNCAVNFPMHIAGTAYIALTWLALIDKKAVINETKNKNN